jgi:DnaJ homolog subfamily C member 7
MSDCQRAVSLQHYDVSAELLTRLGRCQYALGFTTAALSSLRRALDLDSGNAVAQSFRSKALELQRHINDFEGAKSRNHWRMAQTSHDECLRIIRDQGGEVPLEWKCWGIELHIARGKWEAASSAVQ